MGRTPAEVEHDTHQAYIDGQITRADYFARINELHAERIRTSRRPTDRCGCLACRTTRGVDQ